jgi:putative lipoprotein (rSAM/lipoprotein system)
MKNINRFLITSSNKFLAFLLFVLGFSAACSEVACEYGAQMEYGAPHASFIVKGKVTRANTEQAIPDIRVIMGYDTSYSDQNGNYRAEQSAFPTDQSFLLEFTDMDGPQNGQYEAFDTTIEFVDPQFTGGDGDWDRGETEMDIDIRLTPLK